jgi:hypothetical protein
MTVKAALRYLRWRQPRGANIVEALILAGLTAVIVLIVVRATR